MDYPGQLAAIVFTQGCNFRCPYCHNPALVLPELFEQPMDTEWVLRFLYRRRKKLGAVVITGGEPTLQEDIVPFLKLLKAMRFKVKLDTNGSYPEVLQAITSAGLVDYYAMDLKAPLSLYKLVSRYDTKGGEILNSMDVIRKAGVAYEFRTTYFDALLGEQDITAMQAMLKAGDRYIVQECRYGNTLEQLSKPNSSQSSQSFADSAVCSSLVDWGKQHSVAISIRSL